MTEADASAAIALQKDIPDDIKLGGDPPSGDAVEAVARLIDALDAFAQDVDDHGHRGATMAFRYRLRDVRRVLLGDGV